MPTARTNNDDSIDIANLKLHEAIALALLDECNYMTNAEIAHWVNLHMTYTKRDGTAVKPNQIGARIKNYGKYFISFGARIKNYGKYFDKDIIDKTSFGLVYLTADGRALAKKVRKARDDKAVEVVSLEEVEATVAAVDAAAAVLEAADAGTGATAVGVVPGAGGGGAGAGAGAGAGGMSHGKKRARPESPPLTAASFLESEMFERATDGELDNLIELALKQKHKRSECAICLMPRKEASSIKCGHQFCKTCITDYLATSPTCPMCNQACSINDVRQLF